MLIYLKELLERQGLWWGPHGSPPPHTDPHAASQRSHPVQTKSHFPTNSLSEAAGQVINHHRARAEREGEGGAAGGGAGGEPGEGSRQERREGDKDRKEGRGREGGRGKKPQARRGGRTDLKALTEETDLVKRAGKTVVGRHTEPSPPCALSCRGPVLGLLVLILPST